LTEYPAQMEKPTLGSLAIVGLVGGVIGGIASFIL
jgi:hypothetical protein